jgi:hypothetical protein
MFKTLAYVGFKNEDENGNPKKILKIKKTALIRVTIFW